MIEFSDNFKKDVKKLSKKYRLIRNDIEDLIAELEKNSKIGTPLGNDLYKIRVANSSIPTGKSGGFRVITYIVIDEKIILNRIYSKSEKENISDAELIEIIRAIGL